VFRRRPEDLAAAETAKPDGLLERPVRLRTLYDVRGRFQRLCDTTPGRAKALRALTERRLDVLEQFPEMDRFLRTFETWQDEVLNSFEGRQTSGPVEGINNKARVIVRRAYGLKAAGSLGARLVLDLDRGRDVVRHTIEPIRSAVAGPRAAFACT